MLINADPHPLTQPPALRLFCPDDDGPIADRGRRVEPEHPQGLTPEVTLSEFYHQYAEPLRLADQQWAGGTVEQYRLTMQYWSQYTGDPPLAGVDEAVCQRFKLGLMQRAGLIDEKLSANSVLKYLRHAQCVLDMAGPKSRIHGRKAGLDKWGLFGFDADGDRREPPEIARLRSIERTPTPFSLMEMAQWIEACKSAQTPAIPGVEPADFWRALILFSYNVGTRKSTTLQLTRDMIEGEWLVVPPEIMKGRRREGRFWLNDHARSAIDSIRTADRRLFAWPYTPGAFTTAARRLIARSEIKPARRLGAGLHRCRKALLSWLAARNGDVARLQAGHASGGDVLLKHYVHPRIVRRLMARVPQPKLDGPPETDDPQQMLF